ncbi:DMT family transporter [Nocardioides marmoriginsengisoli]|nr:DMT family transporter [Nocardioides marmoriginsengisoli]
MPHGRALVLSIASAVGSSSSGPLAKALLEGGWSPIAVALVRLAVAPLVLVVPAVLALRGRGAEVGSARRGIVVLGIFGISGCVVCYFNAISRLPVGVALMIQYASPLLVLAWTAWRQRRVPPPVTLVGAAVAMAGLVLVVGLVGGSGTSIVGVLWACGGATCLATYFATSDALAELPPAGLAFLSLAVAATTVAVLAAVGAMPLHWSTQSVDIGGHGTPWLVPLVLLVLVATVFAYTTSMASVGVLGARLASFVSLSELISAVLIAWLVLGESPRPVQLLGGLLIAAGVVLVRVEKAAAVPVS